MAAGWLPAHLLIIDALGDARDARNPCSRPSSSSASWAISPLVITFPDEGHGLRHPDHIQRALHAELVHFRQMLRP